MALIYVRNEYYDIKVPCVKKAIEESKIGEKTYLELIKPFFEKTSGFFRANVPKSLRLRHTPLIFLKNHRIGETFNYLMEESPTLEIQIQDATSLWVEEHIKSQTMIDDISDYKSYYTKGLAIQKYKKQTGTINFSKENGVEKIKINLGEIVKCERWVRSCTLTDLALNEILRR